MIIDFENENKVENLGIRVRAILGVPEEILTDEIISSPDFLKKANQYINKQISQYKDLDIDLLTIAFIYYICYLLCFGMNARLPKQMENVSTKTVLQSIDWDSKAIEMLNQCDEIIDEAIEDIGEEVDYSVSFAVLTDASEYPNTLV